MKSFKTSLFAAAALAVGMSALTCTPTIASADGSRNTAIALGAGALYELSQRHIGAGIVLGVGAAIAEQQSQQQRSFDNRSYYRDNGWNRGNGGWDQDRDNRNWNGDRGDRDRNRDQGDRDGSRY